jgi:uncharacterized protein (DUF169 family)
MKALSQDLSIYKKFNFEKPPVCVKFLISRPEGIRQIDKSLPFCEMIKEAQLKNEPFYFTKENEDCVGKVALGMVEMEIAVEGGLVGPKFGIYQEPRANNAMYRHIHTFHRGMVNYVVFSTPDKLTFEPDLLILMARPTQAEIVFRAVSYSTGDPIESRFTPALGCSWMYVYPFQTGKVNYLITGTTFGAKAKQIFEEGWILITIPYQRIPDITRNLNEMEWVLPSYTDGRKNFIKREARLFAEAEKEAGST